MKRIVGILFVTFLFMTGCSRHSETEMPLEMPNDFNFMVRFGYGDVTKNEINTYQGTVTKDLIMKGEATAKIIFTKDEMRGIYHKMRVIDIMGLKEPFEDRGCFKTPSNEDNWKITVDGDTKILSWTDLNCGMTDEVNQLLELRTFIQHLVESKDAYKALPESEGGYD